MTLLRKYYDTGIEGGGIPDEVREKLNIIGCREFNNIVDSDLVLSKSILRGLEKCAHDGYLLASEELAEKIKSEPVNFLLVNALRHLTTEQIKTLADSLYERIPVEMRQEELASLKEENERLRGAVEVYKTDFMVTLNELDAANQIIEYKDIEVDKLTVEIERLNNIKA